MKKKLIIAAMISALLLCSCGENTSSSADITESSTVSQTESTTASETAEIAETEKTESADTAEENMVNDEPTVLDEPINRIYPGSVMPKNMEFTLDLKDITSETDLFALTNMEKYSLGETVTLDLDGDGVDEEISVAEENYNNEWRFLQAVINGKTYNLDRSYNYDFFNIPNEIFICDIDSSDNYYEIACAHSIVTNDYLTSFYRYEDGELKYIFTIYYDTPDGNGEVGNFFDKMNASVTGKPIITDGSGIITAARRLNAQTWLAYSHYAYDSESGEISLVCEPVYPYYYENINNFEMAKELTEEYYIPDVVPERPLPKASNEVTLYKEPDLNSETITLTPQRIYFTSEYPYPAENPDAFGNGLGLWIYLVAEDGTTGWVYSYNGYYFGEEGRDETLSKVFGGLVYYD